MSNRVTIVLYIKDPRHDLCRGFLFFKIFIFYKTFLFFNPPYRQEQRKPLQNNNRKTKNI